ncbi:conserved hypothetical protein [Acinetobacter sp. 8I-beige]|uniref:DUF3732 domain-containing protein n=1 Tax=Acinetobacter sp. 8I-beige TaxID=2653125 RepID=UPI0012F2D7D3|nr:DUF3732 domain-containing protein [Acinetobacter sp. 8I-beige]VXA84860.1 conserved hypothetical protein [Acinetobacter sp. 8I-beige]
MNRWNISKIFFFNAKGDEIREITFDINAVNIITGASGTGKTAIIKALDYCLGSSTCELAAHIRRRSICVGVKWVAGIEELIIARVIPPVGQKTSTKMFVRSGRGLEVPKKFKDLDGACTLDSAKEYIEKVFGIGDIKKKNNFTGKTIGKASVRNLVPFMFITKEVIDSEALLFHGMDDADKSKDFLAALPYYLNISNEETIYIEQQLKKLKNRLELENNKIKSNFNSQEEWINQAKIFLDEARRVGLSYELEDEVNFNEITQALKEILKMDTQASSYPTNSEIALLNSSRKSILDEVNGLYSKLNATKKVILEASGYKGTVARQLNKLELVDHFNLSNTTEKCPVCKSESQIGVSIAEYLKSTLMQIRDENINIKRVEPKLIVLEENLNARLSELNSQLSQVDAQINSWYRQTEELQEYDACSKQQAHLRGKISYFLELFSQGVEHQDIDLEELYSEIQELEAQIDKRAKEIKLRRAELKISKFATENFQCLPTVAPCINAELDFNALKPEINIIEDKTESVLKMSDLGSDQNYLAIHIALAFALHKYFETRKTSVPGVLFLDQISRPYFPSTLKDENVILGIDNDEDINALEKHIEFIFNETTKIEGLQVILLEHAYFSEDKKYVGATKERWGKGSSKALIPLDWDVRADLKK